MSSLLIACDGSCIGRKDETKMIGWAWADADGAWLSNGWKEGTNQRAELHALWSALKFHPTGDIKIQIDSMYALNCVSKWARGWESRGWRKADGEPVLNLDLIRPAYELLKRHKGEVEFMWVKGHLKNNEFPLNTEADKRACEGSARVRAQDFGGAGDFYLDSKGRRELKTENDFVKKVYGLVDVAGVPISAD